MLHKLQKKMNLALIWNYSQPYLKDQYHQYILPTVRHYIQRDYVDMIKISAAYPKLKINYNISPSLVEQILDYDQENTKDYHWLISLKKADELLDWEKEYILTHFFKGQDEVIIYPYPRYRELYQKKLTLLKQKEITDIVNEFSVQDYRDLQIWHNLAWIGKESQKDKALKKLIKKGKHFSQEDKKIVFSAIESIIHHTFSYYKDALEKNKIEVTMTPYFNPDIPLLSHCDIFVQGKNFKGSEIIKEQVINGRKFFKSLFHKTNVGICSYENRVTEDALKLFARLRFTWTVIDENCNKDIQNRLDLTEIWRFGDSNQANINCLMQHTHFYQKFNGEYLQKSVEESVKDFHSEIENIRSQLIEKDKDPSEHIICLVLDGDTFWDKTQFNGDQFLHHLYQTLSESDIVQCVRPIDFLQEKHAERPLKNIHDDSNDFFIQLWNSHKNAKSAMIALLELYETYRKEEKNGEFSEKIVQEVKRNIHVLCANDWFKIYGSDFSKWDVYYDEIYRYYLIDSYEKLFKKVPKKLYYNLKNDFISLFKAIPISKNIYPKIDGYESSETEWEGAAFYDVNKIRIHSGAYYNRFFQSLNLGYNEKSLFFKITFKEYPPISSQLDFDFHYPKETLFHLYILAAQAFIQDNDIENNDERNSKATFSIGKHIEIAIPIEEINLINHSAFSFQIILRNQGKIIEKFPETSVIRSDYYL